MQQLAALVDYRPVVGDPLPAIAWIFTSPKRGKPAAWERTREWERLEGIDADPARVADILDTIVGSLSGGTESQQHETLVDMAGRVVPGGIVWDEPVASRQRSLVDKLIRKTQSDLKADQARYAARRERLHTPAPQRERASGRREAHMPAVG